MATSPSNIPTTKLGVAGADFPSTYWLTITNFNPGWTLIGVPSAGTLWVFYEWSNEPAAQIYVWHQGGATTPINGGANTIPVQSGDAIMYQLNDPVNDGIKLAYQMV
ncbi:MAG TPA: hypothetical protein VEK57_29320 [Thermoanaerobaculia bacterium]|nr:hypothetical protein [Thermoanaerobaculia bacterium]